MPTLVVVKAHPYESRHREVGSEYNATDEDARLLVLSGQARYKGKAPADKGKKQSYATRNLTSGNTKAVSA